MRHDEREVDRRRKANQYHRTQNSQTGGDVTPLTLGEEIVMEEDAILMCVPQLWVEGIISIFVVDVGGER